MKSFHNLCSAIYRSRHRSQRNGNVGIRVYHNVIASFSCACRRLRLRLCSNVVIRVDLFTNTANCNHEARSLESYIADHLHNGGGKALPASRDSVTACTSNGAVPRIVDPAESQQAFPESHRPRGGRLLTLFET